MSVLSQNSPITESSTSGQVVKKGPSELEVRGHKAARYNILQKTVHEEEVYLSHLEKIVERDFFPDLNKLKAKAEYLEALSSGDNGRLRDVCIKYSVTHHAANETPVSSVLRTPSGWDTPLITPTPFNKDKETVHLHSNPCDPEDVITQQNLDSYLSKNTSEDNVNFSELVEDAEKRRRAKYDWFYEQEARMERAKTALSALPGIDEQAVEAPKGVVQTWTGYTAHNSVMYVPPGAPPSQRELLEMQKQKPREILYSNTRYKSNPFQKTASTAVSSLNVPIGKIGTDGKEICPSVRLDPNCNNSLSYLATPSPAPGVAESPLMTWGEIEGTPFRLDGSETPASDLPAFKMPKQTVHDTIATKLADQLSKKSKQQKEMGRGELYKSAVSRTDRVASFSPAARRLLTSRKGTDSGDRLLRASYMPKTPLSSRSSKTPSSRLTTPDSTRSHISLTDDLLDAALFPKPKRKKAKKPAVK